VILTLVDLGVITNPKPGTELGVVIREASEAARAWLGAHPLP
jgi:hypothetical protein